MNAQSGTTHPPFLPSDLPKGCQWLGGEGAGTWFHLSKPSNLPEEEFRIRRYSHEGYIDCDRTFVLSSRNNIEFDIDKPFKFTYLSHCQKCTILQDEQKYIFISCPL
ncbi:MAG TPA: hypothetical protein EYN89_14180 [Flavobacteriales bacterium]|nr:hypothetical protein [Flavobacteriales bacterium]